MTLVFFNLAWPLPNRKHAATTSYLTAVQGHLCSPRAYLEDGRDGESVDGADRFENGAVGMHQVTKMFGGGHASSNPVPNYKRFR